MTEPHLTASVLPATSAVDAAVWDGLVPSTNGEPDNPFLCHAFFAALEESGCATAATGWQAQHIMIERDDVPVALMPLFAKSHSQGEYVFDHGWADAFERAGGRYYPKLQASVPFTPATTPKLLVPSGDVALQGALLDAAERLAERVGASSVHATFIPEAEQTLAAEYGWLTRLDTQFHWHNQDFDDFEGFLSTLTSRKRKAIKRERRDALADGLRVEWVTGNELTEAHWDAFYDFYIDTGNRKWGQPYLNRTFFSLISEKLAHRIVLMFAYDGDQPIAGALNFVGHDRIYGRNWGASRDVPFLHFELCYYQAIDYAIAHGLAVVEAGAQGEHKLARGYEPTITRSAHFIAHPGLRAAIADYLEQERRAIAGLQTELSSYTPFKKGDQTDSND